MDKVALKQVSSEYIGFPCHKYSILIFIYTLLFFFDFLKVPAADATDAPRDEDD
jgi:hypothetical protein